MILKYCFPQSALQFALAGFIAASAHAQVTTDRAIIRFKAGTRPIENVSVQNIGDETLYVTSVTEKVINPGTPQEERQETEEVLVSPKRFSLDGRSDRAVRLLLKEPYGEKEGVYRVKFLPETKGFGIEEKSAKKGEKTATLKVVTAVGILIFAEPAKPLPEFSWTRNEGTIRLSNKGNVNVLLTEGKACKSQGVECADIPVTRLYPGNEHELKIPDGKMVSFKKESLGQFEDIEITAQK